MVQEVQILACQLHKCARSIKYIYLLEKKICNEIKQTNKQPHNLVEAY